MLGLELRGGRRFAATYNALDFRIYMWGGHAVLHDSRLYLALAYGHWFTYSPFAAIVFVPVAALPLAVARVLWDLVSVAALAYSCALVLKLAGYRPSRIMVAGFVAAAMALDPVWQTLFLGQINLILLALILTDIWLVRAARPGGRGRRGGDSRRDQADARHLHRVLPAGPADRGRPSSRRARSSVRAYRLPRRAGRLAALLGAPVPRHRRVGAPYISNQSPYGRRSGSPRGQGHIGWWWVACPARRSPRSGWPRPPSWPGGTTGWRATAVTGTTGLLVSPISWAHHWVWVLPALVLLVRAGHRIAAAAGYLLFAVAPFWFTPHAAGPREYGFHWLLTLVANCFLSPGWSSSATWR